MSRTVTAVIFLTFLGMVGLYVGLYLAYLKYQQYAPQINSAAASLTSGESALSGVTNVLTTLFPAKTPGT